MINPLYAILVIPAAAVVVLACIPSYRVGAVLNMLASGLTFMAGCRSWPSTATAATS